MSFISEVLKKFIVSTMALLLFVICFGEGIPQKQVIELGKRACAQQLPKAIIDSKSDYSINFIADNSDTLFAVFNYGTNGFLILSADDAATPILAYSDESGLNPDESAPAVRYWLELYKNQIKEIKKQGLRADEATKKAWNALKSGSANAAKAADRVKPLVTTLWNQNKYYNFYSPEDAQSPTGYDDKVPVGCVALAMAMIMYTHQYPLQGIGSHSYNSKYGTHTANYGSTTYHYEAMADNLSGYNHEVAQLIYHCAIAVDMNYAPDGSGTYSHLVPAAIQNYFGYDATSKYLQRHGGNNNFTTEQWETLLKDEIDKGFPVYYSGQNSEGGHAFVCDGYDNKGRFHFNFGWGGTGNGYFTVNNDSIDAIGGYKGNQGCVLFHPDENHYPAYCNNNNNIHTYDAIYGVVTDGSGYKNYQNNVNCTWLIAPPQTDYITVGLTSLATEAGVDSLSFWKGNPSRRQLIRTFSGMDTIGTSFTANTDSLYVTFKTNDSIVDNGWRFTYSAHQTQWVCQGITVKYDPSGTWTDGSADNMNYSANSACSLTVEVRSGQWIKLNFSHFDVSPEDVVQVIDPATKLIIASLSGSTIPNEIFIAKNKVKVVFISDNHLQRSGFKLHWTSDLDPIAISDIETQTLKIYPNPAKEQIIVSLPNMADNSYQASIYDISGKAIISQPIFDTTNALIDVSSLQSGFYIIRLLSPNKVWTGKFIIDR